MFRCRWSTVRTVVDAHNGLQRLALWLSLAHAVPRSLQVQVRETQQLARAVSSSENEVRQIYSIEASPFPQLMPGTTRLSTSECALSNSGLGEVTVGDASVTGVCSIQSAPRDTGVPPSNLMSVRDGTSVSAREERPKPTRPPSPVQALRTFLSLTSPSATHSHTPYTLQSLYTSVKSRSQLGALSSRDLSSLISFYGSIAVRRSEDSVTAGEFEHSLISTIEGGDAYQCWSFVRILIEDKEELGRSLSDSDRYWLMRSSLFELGKSEVVAAQLNTSTSRSLQVAQLQHRRLSRHSRSSDIHAAYVDTLLTFGDSCALAEAVVSFTKCLSKLEWVSNGYRDILWKIVLRCGSELSPAVKRRVLSAISHLRNSHNATLFPKLSNGAQVKNATGDTTVSSLLSTVLDITFPCRPSRDHDVHKTVAQWCRTEISLSLNPDQSTESLSFCWRNLVLLAFVDASPDIFTSSGNSPSALGEAEEGPRKSTWEVICALRTLEKAHTLDANSAADVKSIIRILWDQWEGREELQDIPSPVVRAIFASFMHFAGLLRDASLRDALYSSYVSRGIETDTHSSYADLVLVEYLLARILCGAKTWDEAIATPRKFLSTDGARSATVGAVILRLNQIDVHHAFSLYQDARQNAIDLDSDVEVALCKALLSRGSIELALVVMTYSSLPPLHSKILFEALLRELFNRQIRSIQRNVPRLLSLALQKHFQFLVDTLPPHRYIEHVLVLLTEHGLPHDAFKLLELVHGCSPSYFSGRFIRRFLQTLLRHRQFRLAVLLYRLSESKNTTIASTLRPVLLYGLSRSGSSRLASQVSKTLRIGSSGNSCFMSAMKSGKLSTKVASLKMAGRLSRMKQVTFEDTKLLIELLDRAGRTKTVWKRFQEARTRWNSAECTVLGNILLHGELLRRNRRNARRVHKIVASLNKLVREFGFVPDRVTVNVLVKGILSWRRAIGSQHVQALFDTLAASGYPIGKHSVRGGPVFGSQQSVFHSGHLLPKVDSHISFRRHVRPLYRMFIKAFYVRGDPRSATTVLGILKVVEREWRLQLQVRAEARGRGILRKLERCKNTGV